MSPVSVTFSQRGGAASRGLAAEWVVQWGAGGVYDRGWDEFDVAMVDEDFPTSVVHVPVVSFTEQDTIFDTGFTTINPVLPMMRLAHSRGPIAAWENTSVIPGHKRAADG
jgi:hypothetical protein